VDRPADIPVEPSPDWLAPPVPPTTAPPPRRPPPPASTARRFVHALAVFLCLFLVVLDDGKVIGTGAVRKKTDEVAELKRIWLLEEYHGRQIGFRVVNLLIDFAREQGYASVYLESTQRQKRALAFYRRMGFQDVPSPHDAQDFDGVSMEMQL